MGVPSDTYLLHAPDLGEPRAAHRYLARRRIADSDMLKVLKEELGRQQVGWLTPVVAVDPTRVSQE